MEIKYEAVFGPQELFDGEYTKEGETIRPYSTMELGRMLTGTYVE